MLPALIPLAVSLLPQAAEAIGALFAGDRGAEAGQALGQAAKAIIGTDDPAEAQRIVAENPEAATALRIELARIMAEQAVKLAEARNEAARIAAADRANARAMGPDAMRDRVALGSIVIFALSALGSVAAIALFDSPSVAAATGAVMGLTGGAYKDVIGFFFGSSASSATKDRALAEAVTTRRP